MFPTAQSDQLNETPVAEETPALETETPQAEETAVRETEVPEPTSESEVVAETEIVTGDPESRAELLLPVPGITEITLTTAESGVGSKPLFAWEPLPAAATYQLVVYDADGRAYWAWEGSATSVYLGGGDTPPPENSSGPMLGEGMSWAVLAFDDAGAPIGTSVIRSISP